ncbi:hypothetical protein KKA14_12175, partial [bacterium]|nr:hypothetical protein [bacterium]
LIKDTFSQHISIENSGVKIENTVIKSEDTGLAAINSIVQLTGVSISGKTAIFTSNSKLDMAGTSLTGSKSSIESDLDSTAVFSVSRVKSPYRDKWVHTIISLYMGEFY